MPAQLNANALSSALSAGGLQSDSGFRSAGPPQAQAPPALTPEQQRRYDQLVGQGMAPEKALEVVLAEDRGNALIPEAAGAAKQVTADLTRSQGTPEDPGPDNPEDIVSLLSQARQALPGKQTGTGDRVLQALQILGGIGGGIASDRASRRADKETNRRQSTANLINTLRGRAVAGVQPATPTLGTGGRLLQGLGAIGKGGADIRQLERGDAQSKFGNLVTLLGAETDQTQADTAAAREARLGAGGGGSELTDSNIRLLVEDLGAGFYAQGKALEDVEAEAATILRGINVPEDFISIFKGAAINGYRQAKNDGLRLEDADLRIENNVRQLEDALRGRKLGEQKDLNEKLGESVFENTVKSINTARKVPVFTDLYLPLLDDLKVIEGLESVKKGRERLFFRTIEKFYNKAINDTYKDLAKEGGLSNQARMAKADVQALAGKLDHLEKLRGGTEVSGPLSFLVPTVQLFFPNSAAYDHIQIAFALDVAAVLNRGRPSDKDMAAALNLVPSRTDTQRVAKIKFDTLRQLLRESAESIDAQFPMPMNIFDTGKTIEVDGTTIPLYDFTQKASMLEGNRADKALVAKWNEWLEDGDDLQRLEAKEMLKKYGSSLEGDFAGDEF